MRTIKFRGKRLDNGKWLYGDLMHDNVGGQRWVSLAAYVRFEEYAHWYDPRGFDIHDITHWLKIVLPKEK